MIQVVELPEVLTGKDSNGLPYEVSLSDIQAHAWRTCRKILTPDELYGIVAWAGDNPVNFGPVARNIQSAH